MKRSKILGYPVIFLAAVLMLGLLFFTAVPASADPAEEAAGPVITKQPEDAVVSYPDGAEFEVKVKEPEKVASYQWILTDCMGTDFVLEGTSAKTNKLIVPSTLQADNLLSYRCEITDLDGKTVVSDTATLSMDNKAENKTVLYIGCYALEPGEELDLSTTPMGSGIVSFDSDGTTITLDNVTIDNSVNVYDTLLSGAMCFRLDRKANTEEEYYVYLKGENKLINTFYQPKSNGSGITMDFMFTGTKGPQAGADEANQEGPMIIGTEKGDIGGLVDGAIRPTVVLDGTVYGGTLYVSGGSEGIRALGDIVVNTDIVTEPNGNYFMDGIACDTLNVMSDITLNMRVNGAAFSVTDGLTIWEDDEIIINSTAPKVSAGATYKGAVFVGGGTMDLKQGSKLTIVCYAKPEEGLAIGGFAGIMLVNGASLEAEDCDLSIGMFSDASDELYAANFSGISCSGDFTLDKTNFTVLIYAQDVLNASGVHVFGDAVIENSIVSIGVRAMGTVTGLAVEDPLSISGSDVEVSTEYYPYEGQGSSYAIAGYQLDLSIEDPDYSITADAVNQDGIAILAKAGSGDTPKGYDPAYQAQKITLSGMGACLTPEDSKISLASIPASLTPYLYVETWYDETDKTKPANMVELGVNPVAIKTQPADAHVNYPQGAVFEVVVEDPDQVQSYQWYHKDAADQIYVLDGSSAKTNKLVIPATLQNNGDSCQYRCLITNKDGSAAWSDYASLIVDNKDESKLVFYAWEHAVEPGGVLELAECGIGSGRIEFAADGKNVTFDNVDFTNEEAICDHFTSPSTALILYGHERTEEEFYIHLKGTNTLHNYFDDGYGRSGITLDFDLYGEEGEKTFYPAVIIDGEEATSPALLINGGTDAIHSGGSIEIRTRVSTFPINGLDDRASGGIYVENGGLILSEGAEVHLNTNGSAIFVGGQDAGKIDEMNLIVKDGAVLNCYCDAEEPEELPDGEYGMVSLNTIYAGNEIHIEDGAVVTVYLMPSMEKLNEKDSGIDTVQGMIGEGAIILNDASLEIAFIPIGTEGIIESFIGIASRQMQISSSEVVVSAKNDTCGTGTGMEGIDYLYILDNSDVEVNVAANGDVFGIETSNQMVIADSSVLVKTDSDYGDTQIAIAAGSLEVNLTDELHTIRAKTYGGYAVCALIGPSDKPVGYQKNYKPVQITLEELTTITTPVTGAISTSSLYYDAGTYREVETVYDLKDTTKPAASVTISKGIDISKAKVTLEKKSMPYTGKAQKPAVKSVVLDGTTLTAGKDYTVSYKNNKNAGKAAAVVTGCGKYKGTVSAAFTITKAKQPMTVTVKDQKVSAAAVKKADKTVKAITVKKNQGTVTYAKVSVNKKKYAGKFKVNSKTGKITVKKGTPRGTYKIKVRVQAKGNDNYKAGKKNVTVKITVG